MEEEEEEAISVFLDTGYTSTRQVSQHFRRASAGRGSISGRRGGGGGGGARGVGVGVGSGRGESKGNNTRKKTKWGTRSLQLRLRRKIMPQEDGGGEGPPHRPYGMACEREREKIWCSPSLPPGPTRRFLNGNGNGTWQKRSREAGTLCYAVLCCIYRYMSKSDSLFAIIPSPFGFVYNT